MASWTWQWQADGHLSARSPGAQCAPGSCKFFWGMATEPSKYQMLWSCWSVRVQWPWVTSTGMASWTWLASEGGNRVYILLGDGTGKFHLASSPATGASPLSVAVGDFNG